METLDKNYWEERHQNNDTPWHIGLVSTPIKEYIDQIKNIVYLDGNEKCGINKYFHKFYDKNWSPAD